MVFTPYCYLKIISDNSPKKVISPGNSEAIIKRIVDLHKAWIISSAVKGVFTTWVIMVNNK